MRSEPDPAVDGQPPRVATTRRVVLAGAGAAAVAVLTGCATYDSRGGSASSDTGPLAQTTDVPVGGGFINAKRGVVITQPTQGKYLAFSAVCTHQGCTVGDVKDGLIICPCHQSKFRAADGSVAEGPATAPLDPVAITVDGTSIVKA